jgi:hypothetical protein
MLVGSTSGIAFILWRYADAAPFGIAVIPEVATDPCGSYKIRTLRQSTRRPVVYREGRHLSLDPVHAVSGKPAWNRFPQEFNSASSGAAIRSSARRRKSTTAKITARI